MFSWCNALQISTSRRVFVSGTSEANHVPVEQSSESRSHGVNHGQRQHIRLELQRMRFTATIWQSPFASAGFSATETSPNVPESTKVIALYVLGTTLWLLFSGTGMRSFVPSLKGIFHLFGLVQEYERCKQKLIFNS